MPFRFDAIFGLVLVACLGIPDSVQAIDFAHEVVPILKRNCTHCHGGREAEGDFSLNTRASVVQSGMVELDAPAMSHLLELIESTDPDLQMPPPDRPRISEKEIAVLRSWILEGLVWEEGYTFGVDRYEPPLMPRSPVLPVASDEREHPIDRILDHYLSVRNLDRPAQIGDAAFLRRTSLDLIGLLPSTEELDEFLSDDDPRKREKWIDSLLENRIGFADHWLTFFNDLLRNDYSGTGFITGGRKQISQWLYESLLNNKPFDVMARELIAPTTSASQGYIDGIKWRGEVSAGQTLPIQFSQSVSQSFLGINMKCASCHDSFIDRWTLKDAYGLAAIYAETKLELHRCDKPTGEIAEVAWLFPELGQVDASASRPKRLRQLAQLMTDPRNGRFARTIVNRLWYQLMGRGIVHPLDAMQSRPWSEDLLDYLADDLVKNQFDLKLTLRRIAMSEAYQSVAETIEERISAEGSAEDYVYRGPRTKRMSAEQFLDNVWMISGDAPRKFDAPVIRSLGLENPDATTVPGGKWIWRSRQREAQSGKAQSGKAQSGEAGEGDVLPVGNAPGQEMLVLRKSITLSSPAFSGGAVISCDNEFQLFVNNRLVGSGDDWTKPQSIALSPFMKMGDNTFHAVVKNASDHPNPAGLYFDARILLEDGSKLSVVSDASWEFNDRVPKTQNNRLGRFTGKWQGAAVVPTFAAWAAMVSDQCAPLLSAIEAGEQKQPMVRAALLKNTALMKSLGRPMREQIVSMRPATVTTLEAIDLANEPTLAKSFLTGANRLIDEHNGNTRQIIHSLFRNALTRNPTSKELELLKSALGNQPDPMAVQDIMWAVCMLPEFLLIR